MSNSRPHVKLLVIIPVGPGSDGVDTIESILTYCTESVAILVIDNSQSEHTRKLIEQTSPKVTILEFPGYTELGGELFCRLALSYLYALENFTFDVLMHMDTDALIVGDRPEDAALQLLRDKPRAGMLGSYKIDSNGQPRDFTVVDRMIQREIGAEGLSHPRRRTTLRSWLEQATANGYQSGESCLGAAVYMRPETIQAFARRGFLSQAHDLHSSHLCEDHLFSMLTIACGYTMEDFATGDLPMDLRWRGMPRAPEAVDTNIKKIVHSTKFWRDMPKEDIYAYYRQQRQARVGSE